MIGFFSLEGGEDETFIDPLAGARSYIASAQILVTSSPTFRRIGTYFRYVQVNGKIVDTGDQSFEVKGPIRLSAWHVEDASRTWMLFGG